MKLKVRSIHRDFGYFYLGLIISFSISGIFLNHRRDWYPTKYVYESQEISYAVPQSQENINDEFINEFSRSFKIKDDLRQYRIRNNNLRISYASTDVDIDVISGKGRIGKYFKVPLLAQMTNLHVTTNPWWIYYSDIFGLAMLTIAITGMFIKKGKTSFMRRGWKLASIGLAFPLLFLFFLS